MSVVSLLNVDIKNNPAAFGAKYEFEITFECLEPLQKDLEWKLTYVGSATSAEHDQVLDTLLVGPVPVGVNKFMLEADSPDLSKIPDTEIVGVTVILLSCAYDDREFVRVGYYVNNEYTDEALIADPPTKPIIEKVRRSILAEKPRVTRFSIKWDSEESAPAEFPPEQPEADIAEDDEAAYAAEELAEEETEATEDIEAPKVEGEDAEMAGTEEENAQADVAKEEEDDDEAGSEDLEAESSGEEDEEELEEEGEEEAGEDADEMDVGADGEKENGGVHTKETASAAEQQQHQAQDVMVH